MLYNLLLADIGFAFPGSCGIFGEICSVKGLSFGIKDYTKELKTVECISFLG